MNLLYIVMYIDFILYVARTPYAHVYHRAGGFFLYLFVLITFVYFLYFLYCKFEFKIKDIGSITALLSNIV